MQILGLHYDRPYLRLAAIDYKGKRARIQSLKSWVPNSPEDVKQIYTPKRANRIATAIPALVRHLEFKISSSKQVEQILPFQIESVTSISLEDLVYTPTLFPTDTGLGATIFFTSKESLKNHLEEWKSLFWIPDLVTSTATALVRFAHFRCPDLSNAILIDLGSQEWTCIWLENGNVKKTFIIDEGVESLIAALWEDRKKVLFQKEIEGVAKQIDLIQLKAHLNPHLSARLIKLRNKLSNVLFAFYEAGNVKSVFFTGRIDAFGHLRDYLLEIAPEFSLYEPPLALPIDEYKFAIPIGSALEHSAKQKEKVQFLKGEFTPQKSWTRAGFWGIFLLLFSIFFSAILGISGYCRYKNQKEEIADSFQKVLQRTDKILADNLFLAGIEEGIEQAISAIQKHDKEAPYLPQTPSVSEVLAWLSSHPLLEALQSTNDPLDIQNIKYQLISFPHIGAMRDPYRGKVELEFQVKSPMNARKFHEVLLQGDSMVDPNEEITWETLSDTYRTSFYLKNRVFYVR